MIWLKSMSIIYSKFTIKPFRRTLRKINEIRKLKNRNRILIATREGLKYELNLNEQIDSSIYYNGCFEPKTVKIITKYVKPGMTVLDVGANIGCHTLRLAELVGKNGKVIAFEPMSIAYSKLIRNLSLNKIDNVSTEKIALSNKSIGEQLVHFYANWPLDYDLHTRIHPIHKGKMRDDVVPVLTIDDYVAKKEIKQIDFIKIDVDGYEYKVICGGINSIKKYKPTMIIEFGKYTLKDFGDDLENLIDLLDSLGYFFYSEDDLLQYEGKEQLMNSVPSDSTINILCKSKPDLKSEENDNETY